MTDLATTRRALLGGLAGAAALGATVPRAGAVAPPPLPSLAGRAQRDRRRRSAPAHPGRDRDLRQGAIRS